MVVISDTTAITNLIKIDLLFVLPRLYGEVIIPKAVYDELSAHSNQKDIVDNSSWIRIIHIPASDKLKELSKRIDRGEAEAIVLAIELSSDYLIIDELQGRRIAKSYHIEIIGLLGILLLSKEEGLIESVSQYLQTLKNKIGFRISDKLYDFILKKANEKDG